MITSDAGKTLKKIINRIAGFKVIEEASNRHARTGKHGSAAENVGIRINNFLLNHFYSVASARFMFKQNNRSLLRRVITFTRAHLRIFHAAHLNSNFAKLAVASLVRRIVAEAVLRADLVRNLRERRPRVA